MAWYNWSRTASSNATADPTVNWAEGQSPSSVNDSARAMMARTAEWRDDVSGAIVTAGSSTAYTVTSFQVFNTLANMANQMIAFTPHATNGATVTLNVDGLGAKPLRSAPSVELPSGSLILGTPYVATYNNSDAAFYLQGGASNPYSCPLGGGMIYTATTAPNSAFVFPYGQAISRTTYASYFSLVGTAFGTGDGSTTFNVLDLRGYVPAGLDNMGGSAAGRLAGFTFPGAAGGAQTHTLTSTEIPSHTHSGTTGGESNTHTHAFQQLNINNGASSLIAVLVPIGTGGGAPASATESAGHTHPITTDGGTGGGGSHSIVQPTIGVNYILRII
jgi:microcystin-dependent protein